jgi:hypothetical protein
VKLTTEQTTDVVQDLNALTDFVVAFDKKWKTILGGDFTRPAEEIFEKPEDCQRFTEAATRFEQTLDGLDQ